MMDIVKELVIKEFDKELSLGHIEDVTINRLLDLSEININRCRVIIFDIRIKLEKITLKLLSNIENPDDIQLYINENKIGIIKDRNETQKYIGYVFKLLKSVL